VNDEGLFDGFERIDGDGFEIVVEVPDGRLHVAVSEERLDGADVSRVAIHGDSGGAAEVVQSELARDSDGAAELKEFVAERSGVEEDFGARAVMVLAEPELVNEGHGVAHLALVDEDAHSFSDRESEAFAAFGAKAELAAGGVVVLRAEQRGGGGTDGEIGAKTYPEAEVGRRGGDEVGAFFVGGGDVARAEAGILLDQVIEARGSVVLPEQAEETADGAYFVGERRMGVTRAADGLVDFDNVGRGELGGGGGTEMRNEELGGLISRRPVVSPLDCGE